MSYPSVDRLQKLLADDVFHYAKDAKKASGRALGTLVEIITFYALKAWGMERTAALKEHLLDYLGRDRVTNRRMREIIFPALLKTKVLTRDQVKKAFLDFDPKYDESKIGYYLTLVSSQLGMTENDFLRQVVAYEYPRHHWEKDNFSIRDQYRELVKEVLAELKEK